MEFEVAHMEYDSVQTEERFAWLYDNTPTNSYELLKGRDVVQRICDIFGPTKKIQALNEREPFIFRIEFDSVDAATRITHLLANEQRFSLSDNLFTLHSHSLYQLVLHPQCLIQFSLTRLHLNRARPTTTALRQPS
jgi:hypothetical protein